MRLGTYHQSYPLLEPDLHPLLPPLAQFPPISYIHWIALQLAPTLHWIQCRLLSLAVPE